MISLKYPQLSFPVLDDVWFTCTPCASNENCSREVVGTELSKLLVQYWGIGWEMQPSRYPLKIAMRPIALTMPKPQGSWISEKHNQQLHACFPSGNIQCRYTWIVCAMKTTDHRLNIRTHMCMARKEVSGQHELLAYSRHASGYDILLLVQHDFAIDNGGNPLTQINIAEDALSQVQYMLVRFMKGAWFLNYSNK